MPCVPGREEMTDVRSPFFDGGIVYMERREERAKAADAPLQGNI